MALPQQRTLTDDEGRPWLVTVDRGRLVLDNGLRRYVFADPTELRALAPQLTRAVVEHDLDVQEAAAKASATRRLRRAQAGEPLGNRHRPVVEAAEPALALDPLIVGATA